LQASSPGSQLRPLAGDGHGLLQIITLQYIVVIHKDDEGPLREPDRPDARGRQPGHWFLLDLSPRMPCHIELPPQWRVGSVVHDDEAPLVSRQRLRAQRIKGSPDIMRPGIPGAKQYTQ